jgi:hypothetical protein
LAIANGESDELITGVIEATYSFTFEHLLSLGPSMNESMDVRRACAYTHISARVKVGLTNLSSPSSMAIEMDDDGHAWLEEQFAIRSVTCFVPGLAGP